MADDFDVEAMLEETYRRQEPGDVGYRDRDDGRNVDKRKQSYERERRRSRSRDRDRRRDDRDRKGDRNRDRDDRRDRSMRDDKPRYRSRSKSPQSKEDRRLGRRASSPVARKRTPSPELNPEERDARTVFCMQLAARIRPRDLEEFFSAAGKVHDVRLILDNKSHRSKGIAYVEFEEVDTVPLAMGLSGQRLLGIPIIVQPSHAERNRIASAAAAAMKASSDTGPMRLYVGSLHYNINEEMLRGIFEPFGKIDDFKLMKDHQTGRSAGYGFITYHNADDAKKAMDQLNGFELAGRPMKVGNVTEHNPESSGGSYYDVDDMDRAGFGLGATGRIQLMAKLAEGTGMQIPAAAATVLNQQHQPPVTTAPAPVVTQQSMPPIATQCFMLSNMFDAKTRERGGGRWETSLMDDVIGECQQHGGVLHIYIDRDSEPGNIYVKCPSVAAAISSVNALHGRFYAGKLITAAYVPLPNYHSLFPDSAQATTLVLPSSARVQTAT